LIIPIVAAEVASSSVLNKAGDTIESTMGYHNLAALLEVKCALGFMWVHACNFM
jgi:hypothetical protein